MDANFAKFCVDLLLWLTDMSSYVCVSGGKKCFFFGKFAVLCFLETTVLRLALFSYYRRCHVMSNMIIVEKNKYR